MSRAPSEEDEYDWQEGEDANLFINGREDEDEATEDWNPPSSQTASYDEE